RLRTNSSALKHTSIAVTLLEQYSSNMIATCENLTTTSNLTTPTASPTATRSPTPAKIPVRGSKLIYAPAPRYPTEARRSRGAGQSSGSFRVLFDTNGNAVAVQTMRSTGNPSLDQAAVAALHEWRSEPGREWSLVVP